MPVSLRQPLRRLSQTEFGELSFEVMRHVFAIHNEIGRFFDERIYKRELAARMSAVRLEEPLEISFGSFQKTYFVDVLVADGGLFEFKSAESLSDQHRAQLLQYLMLGDVSHGKLINVRAEQVEHEYVNSHWRHEDRIRFDVESSRWNANLPGATQFYEFMLGLLRDLGTGLGIHLYEEAVAHCFGGAAKVGTDIPVKINDRQIGQQRFHLLAPGIAMKITAFEEPPGNFEVHARRLLAHVDLRAIVWLNIGMKKVTFATLK